MRIATRLPLLMLFAAGSGCERAEKYTTTVELVDIERFGDAPENAQQVNFEMRYADCPGENRRVLRGDRQLAECTKGLVEGDKVKMEISVRWNSDRGFYQTEVLKLGGCAVRQDRKEEANYEMSMLCTDLKSTGAVVGVHCDRSRPKELVEKCPFLRRR